MMRTLPFNNRKITLQDAPAFINNPQLMQEIETHWQAQQVKKNNKLFNGKIFSVDKITDNEIIGHVSQYKFFLAQKLQPALFDILNIQPLAVSGLTECQNGYIFGLRGSTTQDQGRWELVPSGSIDCTQFNDHLYETQILTELKEEIGVTKDYIHSIHPFKLVIDPIDHVIDIGIHIQLNCNFDEVEKRYVQTKNNEYMKLRVTAKNELTRFIENNDVIPVSWHLIF